jgi:hypothetical protein
MQLILVETSVCRDSLSEYDSLFACADAEMLHYYNAEEQDDSEVLMNSRNLASQRSNDRNRANDSVSDAWPPLPSQIGSALTLLSQTSLNSELSPAIESEFIWPELLPLTYYGYSFKQLNSLYGGLFTHLSYIINLGDSFLRDNLLSFLKSFWCRLNQKGLWYRPSLSNLVEDGSTMEKLLKGFNCAETFKRGSVADLLRLRILRILLYHHFKELRIVI